MRISFYDFLNLHDQDQYEIVFNKGEHIEILIEDEKRFVLYAVDLFFVEVEYDNDTGKIVNKRAFVSGEVLNKYFSLGI